jgi:hypothetical protein
LSQSRKLKAERKRQSRIIRIFDDVPTEEEAGRAAVPITSPAADQGTAPRTGRSHAALKAAIASSRVAA